MVFVFILPRVVTEWSLCICECGKVTLVLRELFLIALNKVDVQLRGLDLGGGLGLPSYPGGSGGLLPLIPSGESDESVCKLSWSRSSMLSWHQARAIAGERGYFFPPSPVYDLCEVTGVELYKGVCVSSFISAQGGGLYAPGLGSTRAGMECVAGCSGSDMLLVSYTASRRLSSDLGD